MALTLSAAVGTALCGVAATYVFLWIIVNFTQDSNEPPLISNNIPFVSPLLGMVRWSKDFHAHMRDVHPDLPIYTLRLPGTRLYIINSLELIPVVQRHWRTLIFAPIPAKAAQAAMGASKDAMAVIERDLVTEAGFLNGMVKATHPTMSNGPALDSLNAKAFEVFDRALEKFASSPHTVHLWEWVSSLIMSATTEAIYGPSNPMREKQNLDAWHQYHPSLMFLVLDLFPPNIFFRTAMQGREQLIASFASYYADGSYKQGSAYIQKFTNHCISHKIPEKDIPRLLLGTIFNNVANTIPAAFWVVFHIFSDATIVKECYDEVRRAVTRNQDGISTIDLSFVLHSCPTLLSTYHEVFRYHGMANSVRVVSEDHLLDNKYLLKKGGLVMMSARAQHKNSTVWGENVEAFYHKRFLKGQGKRINPVAFRGFGGGTTLCPGRHFATSEILLLATLLLLRFEIRPTKPWKTPSTAKSSQAEAVEQPDEDIEVELIPRTEAIGTTWRVEFSGRRDADLMA